MLVNSSSSKKGSKNKKKRKITKQKGGAGQEKGQGDILKRCMLPLWQRRPLEENPRPTWS